MSRLAVAGLALLLVACSALPPAPGPQAGGSADPLAELARQNRGRAEAAMRGGRWADAIDRWEVAALAQPDSDAPARLAEARSRAVEAARESLRLAAEARRRNDSEAASNEYLRVLLADRDNATALAGLREIERERMARAYFNRPPRGLIAPLGP